MSIQIEENYRVRLLVSPSHRNAVAFPLQCRCLSIAMPLPFHCNAAAFPLQFRYDEISFEKSDPHEST